MSEKCKICDDEVSSHELKCMFCKNLFHQKCGNISLNECMIVNKPNNIYWCCDNCAGFIKSDILMTILMKVSSLEKSVDQINSKITNAADDLKLGPNTRSKKAVLKRKNSNSDSSIASSSSAPPAKKSVPENAGLIPISFSDAVSQPETVPSTSTQPETALPETEVIGNNIVAMTSPAPAVPFSVVEDRRWIHASRFRPDTTGESVESWLKTKLNSNDVLCFPLVPRGRKIEDLRTISFKIAVPASMIEIAKDRSTWPKGVSIRDFVEILASIPDVSSA